jgi:hypothetical protein
MKQGGKCGGVFVNRIFEKMVNDRLGSKSGLTDMGRHQVWAITPFQPGLSEIAQIVTVIESF